QGRIDAFAEGGAALAPYRMIAADGQFVPPGPEARPLAAAEPAVTMENPPGLYGSEEGMVAHNLLGPDAAFTAVSVPQTALPVSRARYAFNESVDLRGPLIAAALLLMALDTLAVLWMGGAFARGPRRRAGPSPA